MYNIITTAIKTTIQENFMSFIFKYFTYGIFYLCSFFSKKDVAWDKKLNDLLDDFEQDKFYLSVTLHDCGEYFKIQTVTFLNKDTDESWEISYLLDRTQPYTLYKHNGICDSYVWNASGFIRLRTVLRFDKLIIDPITRLKI